jgi:tetratricopeptide (TPR) repeat protein
MKMAWVPVFLLLGIPVCIFDSSGASSRAVVREYEQIFTTYPFSDPDPVPTMSRFYPYFRYDGYTDQPVQKKWKVVELSNDYLRVLILPEIGGKIWAAIEKSTGKSFIYFNHVVKFRDVSMRGPWTSGGIEPNYGIMGHTPNCFSPVDYLVRRNSDGSASCCIGVLDLLTRSQWRLEIRLPAGQACFTTRSFWHNGSNLEEPYYTWMNVGIRAAGNLEFVYPGTAYLGHDGRAFAWPTNHANGREISWYERNDFGSYKSYHVIGRPADFFGGYWHDDDFGVARCSSFADKPGRKIWIWGLSREGMLWEDLLTDTDGQYVEVQSGRLFNQADESSSRTPFKHKEFPPYASDTWTEHWEPVKGTKGFVSASPWGALNVSHAADQLIIRISPSQPLRAPLEVLDGTNVVWKEALNLHPMQPVEKVIHLPDTVRALRVCVGGDKLVYMADAEPSTRPLESPSGFDWNSTYGKYLKGKESARQRAYPRAVQELAACLTSDPDFTPALAEMAALANRRGDYEGACNYARRALSVDAYDGAANYQFGIASAARGHRSDALDGFSIAALSLGWRSAANTELAKLFLREKKYARALSSAEESLRYNSRNLDALQVITTVHRLQDQPAAAGRDLTQLLELDPLNHFARFERYLLKKGDQHEMTDLIQNELPQETYLELAVWYCGVGRDQEAAKLLDMAPPTAEVLYWLAYLRRDPGLLAQAQAASPEFVFPFRRESIPVFEWADSQTTGWQPKYFLGLIQWSLGNLDTARRLLTAGGDTSRFAPFYAARAQVVETGVQKDLETAARLDPSQWRFGVMLVRYHLQDGNAAAALVVAEDYAKRFPKNGSLAVLRVKALVAGSRYQAAADLLDSLSLLPCEGSTEAHALFRQANLELAAENLHAQKFEEALSRVRTARQWPERLGSGRPYDADLDERFDDWVEYRCLVKAQKPTEAKEALARVLAPASKTGRRGIGELIHALALASADRKGQAEQLLEDWQKAEPSSPWPAWGLDLLRGRDALPLGINGVEARVLAEACR